VETVDWIFVHVLPYVALGLYVGYVHCKFGIVRLEQDHLKDHHIKYLRQDLNELELKMLNKPERVDVNGCFHMLSERLSIIETKLAERDRK
jgi:hypothetical protein